MGHWAAWEFGMANLPQQCIIFGGTSSSSIIEQVLAEYEKVIYRKHDNYEAYIVEQSDKNTLLLFQVYGAAMVADLIFLLCDGGVEEIVFIGWAYGLHKNLVVGDYVLPVGVQCLDGVASTLDSIDMCYPHPELRNAIRYQLDQNTIRYLSATTASIPTTFFHPSRDLYHGDVVALELELASVLHFSDKLGIKACGLLVISDTEEHLLNEDHESREINLFVTFKIAKAVFESKSG